MQNPSPKPPLSVKLRILIGIISIPSVILALMLASLAISGRAGEISVMEVIYALVGMFALYMAISGKRFF